MAIKWRGGYEGRLPVRLRAAAGGRCRSIFAVTATASGRWYWHWDPKFVERLGTEVPVSDFDMLLEVALPNIRVPTLLVRGKLSDVVTEEGVQDFLKKAPGSKLFDVGGAAHMGAYARIVQSA